MSNFYEQMYKYSQQIKPVPVHEAGMVAGQKPVVAANPGPEEESEPEVNLQQHTKRLKEVLKQMQPKKGKSKEVKPQQVQPSLVKLINNIRSGSVL